MKDIVTVGIDTSGVSLHKRGYRQLSSKAPITETLAAALILLTPWKKDRIFIDPFCGSGTFPIEAAMIAANIAPDESLFHGGGVDKLDSAKTLVRGGG